MSDETKTAPPVLPKGNVTHGQAPVSGTDTVTVACKVANGLELPEYVLGEEQEPMFGGGTRTVKVWKPTGRKIVLFGPARATEQMRQGIYPDFQLAGGAALTTGVPRDLWENIERVYTEHRYEAFLNRQVFSVGDAGRTAAKAKELASEPSGLEPVDPANPVRRTGQRSITTAERPRAA